MRYSVCRGPMWVVAGAAAFVGCDAHATRALDAAPAPDATLPRCYPRDDAGATGSATASVVFDQVVPVSLNGEFRGVARQTATGIVVLLTASTHALGEDGTVIRNGGYPSGDDTRYFLVDAEVGAGGELGALMAHVSGNVRTLAFCVLGTTGEFDPSRCVELPGAGV